mmetsp:Transcript_1737/g.3559  ORF Transcript_1737/g.3559 Transcript_1737/m.3559 type:complete len:94 (-) Transcript_1737:369-650(-)
MKRETEPPLLSMLSQAEGRAVRAHNHAPRRRLFTATEKVVAGGRLPSSAGSVGLHVSFGRLGAQSKRALVEAETQLHAQREPRKGMHSKAQLS